MSSKTRQELLEGIEQLEAGMAYWNNLATELEENGMRKDAEIAELTADRDGHQSNAYDLRQMIESAESLEELQEELRIRHWL